MRRQTFGNGGARRDLGLIQQPHREFGELAFFVRRVDRRLQILVGDHAQQGRSNVDALLVKIEQAFKTVMLAHFSMEGFASIITIYFHFASHLLSLRTTLDRWC